MLADLLTGCWNFRARRLLGHYIPITTLCSKRCRHELVHKCIPTFVSSLVFFTLREIGPFFKNKFSSNVCLGGFAGSEPSLSIACCAGPDPTTRSRNSSAMAEFYSNV